MTTDHGFTLVWEKDIPECKSLARFWRHGQTGAELLSFSNADENKVFGVSFRTPPEDSTGLPHILEHSVLCGSEKYPVKEPFVELLKGSLQTFLNAFTYPDKTCYPVASANVRDFRNLTDVYLDAVFFPLIPEEVFQQEGWHLELNGKGGFVFKGVVYNEMKGVFSSPESVLSRFSQQALFPDTVYGLESGGDPEVIPDLTYEEFAAFHKACYHPTNARFFFWGDDAEDERLEQVGKVLSRFTRGRPAPRIALQERKAEPKTLTIPFVAGEDETKGMVCCNWLLADAHDVTLTLGFRMLDHILLGMPASPLRRALIESGLGEDITGNGLEDELLQSSFSVGLRGVLPENASRVEPLILETLRRLADDGIEAKYTDAAVNSVEFTLREKNSGRFPVGLVVMLQALTTWLHDGDPVAPLRYEEPLAAIKGKLAAREPYFENLIRRYFLENTHRATIMLTPDHALGAVKAEEEAERVNRVLASLPEAERARLAEKAARLQALQEAPDNPQDLARIPRLAVSDIPRAEKPIPGETTALGNGPRLHFHDLPTGGISYVDAFFNLDGVPGGLFPLLPLMGRALTEMGTSQRNFVDLNMAIASKTGGLDAGPLFYTARADRTALPRFTVSGKVAPGKIPDLFGLMEEIILAPDFGQRERFLRMVLEEKARLEQGLIPAGHTYVSTRLRSAQSATGMMEEMTGGVSYLFFLRELADRAAGDWPSVRRDLDALHAAVFSRRNLDWNVTGEKDFREALLASAEKLTAALPAAAPSGGDHGIAKAPNAREALLLPAQVNYVGQGGNLYDAGYAYHGSVHGILKQLRTGWLWEKVRVQGGAYGAFCSFDRMAGSFVLASNRDPHVPATHAILARTAGYHAKADIPRLRDPAFTLALRAVVAFLLPAACGAASSALAITGDSPELRRKMRDEILATTPDHFRAFAAYLEKALESGPVCVLGGDLLDKTASGRDGWARIKVL